MKIWRKVLQGFFKAKLDREMSEEMRLHLERRVEEGMEQGLSHEEARWAALRRLGHQEGFKEVARDGRGLQWLEQLAQDFRFAARGFRKRPGFTAVAVLTLALGIGVNTALFSVIYGVLLDPYPYAKSNEIWAPELIDSTTGGHSGLQMTDYLEMAKLPAVRSAMATAVSRVTLSGGTNPELVTAPRVTDTAFDFLGVPAILGRGFTAADFQANGEPQPVTVLSYKLWQRLFNGSPEALGQTLVIDDQPHAIIGVMPPRFGWYTNDGLWLPLSATNRQRWVRPIVRLKSDATSEQAGQQLLALLQNTAKQTPDRFPKNGFTARFKNYLDVSVASGEMRSSLQLLFCAAGFLLLIACTNVANLQLARAAGRQREIAVRLAMGATRGRLVRQLVTESVGLSALGCVIGVLFAFWLTQAIVVLMPSDYVPNEARVTMNGWVLTFSVAVSFVTGVLFGLAPAFQGTRVGINAGLKSGGSGAAAASSGNRLRSTLVVAEVALSIVLLVGAGLMIRGFIALQRVDRGFDAERMIAFSVPLAPKRYVSMEQRHGFALEFLERIRRLPGVVAGTLGAAAGVESSSGVSIPGQPKLTEGLSVNYVDAGYLATLNIALLAGRNLTEHDVARRSRVALITQSAAKLWTDGQSPIGRTISVDSLVVGNSSNLVPPDALKEVTVVGIIPDLHSGDRRSRQAPTILVPYTLRGPLRRMFLLRTRDDPKDIVNMVRAELRAMDPELPMHQPLVLEEILRRQEAQPRFTLALFSVFAGIALALAAVGIYSVLSYVVAQRTREIGVRIALGATRNDILRWVFGTGGRLIGTGILLGLGVSVVLATVVKSQVFHVPLLDPVALLAAAAVLGFAGLLACLIPGRRAVAVEPTVALRAE